MAKVSLRIYNREIESLIDQGHLDEAIAHCHHILQTFPKHLETYRLLGKTYLEAKHHGEAVDIFSRVLMAVPDDFVSHVGMSIVRDDEGKLDDAIWHMERAFESQPSNAAIQGELQRLYGRRDGVEPPKIRMTRGALAHMYVQGELYPQAISEIRSVLSQDPQRTDMQVLLARAFFRGGQKADASDMCSQLLKRYTYCFDANRIMVELIPASDRVESTQVYRHRVNELDPYSMFAKESVFHANEVPDASVNLERLEYTGQAVELTQDWGTSLGIGLESGSKVSDEQPDWLKAGLSETRQEASILQKAEDEASFSASQEPASTAEEKPGSTFDTDIPDFLREAGWTESSGAAEEPGTFDSSAADDLAPADIPDWLKNQMPSEPEQTPKPAAPSGNVPDWLSGLGSVESAEPAATSNEIPDWLNDLDKVQSPQPASEPELTTKDDLRPDWLPPEDKTEVKATEPEYAEPLEPAPRSATLETLGTSAKEQDDAVAWLEMLAAKHGAKPEELVTDPNARTEKPPEWVEQAKSLAESKPAGETPAPEPTMDETGIWLRELDEKESRSPVIGEEEKPTLSESGVPDWLSGIKSQSAPKSSEEESLAQADVPDWLSELKNEADVQPQGEDALRQSPDLPDWLSGMQDETTAMQVESGESTSEGEGASEWSSELEKEEPPGQKAVSEPKTQPVIKQRSEVPDWLKGLDSESSEGMEEQAGELPVGQAVPPVSEAEKSFDQTTMQEEPAPVAEDLPEWLRGIDESQPEELPEEQLTPLPVETEEPFDQTQDRPAPVTSAAAELPEWLRGLDETRPEEELPEEQLTPVLSEAEEPTPSQLAAADLPEWLRGLDENPPKESQAEERESLPSWLKSDFEEVEPRPSPVSSADDWRPIEPEPESPAETPEPEFAMTQPPQREPVEKPVPPPDVRKPPPPPEKKPVRQARVRSASEPTPTTTVALGLAQSELNRGDIPAALDHYNKLIKKGKHLDETIRDLRESLYRYPVEVSIWQALGDAYMRANRLQEALDAYNKAEELLR
jgi:tetratricopeptide (TPR) repeat protein